MKKLTIVGAGPVGCVLALYLARRGYPVEIFEKRKDSRKGKGDAGRSINLVLTRRGIRALEGVGLKERALAITVPVAGRMIHSREGELTYQPYGKDESECNYSVSRRQLNEWLVTEVERAGVRVHFGHQLQSLDLPEMQLTFTNGHHQPVAHVLAADGAGSALRTELQKSRLINSSTTPLAHGYKELLIPAETNGRYAMDKNALHIWPRGGLMFMALPNLDGSFTGTLYMPNEDFHALTGDEAVMELFRREFPDALAKMPGIREEFFANPLGELATVKCATWYTSDQVCLFGDAAHAIVPFFGQGMNCGFEDCRVFDAILGETQDLADAFQRYYYSRKVHTDAIAVMAVENFVEMRDKVGDLKFLMKKRIENLLEKSMPLDFRSRYSMVMYSHIPFHQAMQAGAIQSSIVDRLSQGISRPEDYDQDRARQLVQTELKPFLNKNKISLDF